MDPVRELPYWPAAKALHIEAEQMAASDYVPTYPNLPLASEGASTEARQMRRIVLQLVLCSARKLARNAGWHDYC